MQWKSEDFNSQKFDDSLDSNDTLYMCVVDLNLVQRENLKVTCSHMGVKVEMVDRVMHLLKHSQGSGNILMINLHQLQLNLIWMALNEDTCYQNVICAAIIKGFGNLTFFGYVMNTCYAFAAFYV